MPQPGNRSGPSWLLAFALFFASTPAVAGDVRAWVGELEPGAADWQRCAVCHGEAGAGRPDGTFPKIAGQYGAVIRAQLEAIRSGERPNPVMQSHVEDLVDARDVSDVVAYIEAMPLDATCHVGPGGDLELGERIYRNSCASCHGEKGQGDAAQRVPWIACQHYAYLLRRARQLASWGRSAHPIVEPPLAALTDAQLRAVMDHASRLPALTPALTPASVESDESDATKPGADPPGRH